MSNPSVEAEDLIGVLRFRASRAPDKVALRTDDLALTYRQIEEASNQVARAISAAGLTAETRVAIATKNSAHQPAIWWGAMQARTPLVLVNYRLTRSEIAYILNDSQAQIIFVGSDLYTLAEAVLPECPGLKMIVAIDGGHPTWTSLDAFKDDHSKEPVEVDVASSDVALQIYTSGTTGNPKGVLTSHANLLADQHRNEELRIWTDTDRLLLVMPMCHIGGTGVLLRSIYFGMQIELMKEFDAAEVVRRMVERKITKVVFVPSMLNFLLETPGCREADFSHLDLIWYGAAAMPYELLLRAMKVFNCRFGSAFGMTETNGGVTFLSPEDHVGEKAERRLRSCGVPQGARIKIVDEDGNEVPQGQAGEVLVSSPQVTSGYYRLPDETAKCFQDGWLRTGDAGYFDEEGYLYITDRLKDMIVSGALNIYPREVEEVMLAHPAVLEVAVIGIPDDRWQEAVKAVVVLKKGMTATEQELIDFVRERVAKYKVPQSVDFIDALPRNTAGKVLKRELRLPFWQGRDRLV